jgi:hypothetical protein
MKTVTSVLLLLLAGSLWGMVEILPVSTAIHCAFGVLFLVAARFLLPRPGSAILIGLIVCMYKTAGVSFFECQWAGVLSLAVSFEIMVALFHSRIANPTRGAAIIGVGTCLLALPLFVGWITLIAQHPYWVAGGWARILDYALYTTAPAAVASAFLAPLGRHLAVIFDRHRPLEHVSAPWLAAVILMLCWSVAILA